jgi:stearoyl-CoA desaturase (delta-9 desaturase)
VLCQLNLYLTTAVLHRGLTHGAIAYPRWLERAVVLWLFVTVCIPPLSWIAAHKHHHAHADTGDDPHSPAKVGVWRVMLLTWYYVPTWARGHWDTAQALYLRPFRDDRLLYFLDRPAVSNLNFWGQVGLSVLLGPAAIAFWLARLVPYMVMSGYVNAVGHAYGERPFDNLGTDAARPWQKLFGFIAGGEPLGHNFHHRYPKSPTFRPRAFDPGLWFALRVLRGVPVGRPGVPAGAEAAGAEG